MIILDTNVLSEPTKAKPNADVVTWLNCQPKAGLFVTTITWAELHRGVACMPQGKRQANMLRFLQGYKKDLFGPRFLNFEEATAEVYAEIMARAKASGLAIGLADGLIAAIALEHGFSVATRDVAPFEAAGVDVINPWMAR